MKFRYIWGSAVASTIAAIFLAACDQTPVEPAPVEAAPPVVDSGTEARWGLVACTGDLTGPSLSCSTQGGTELAPAFSIVPGDSGRELIVGGQAEYLQLSSSNVAYDSGTELFTFDVTLQNLLPQPMATTDGTVLHPEGARVFFHQEPVATSGIGTITVRGDSIGTFTSTNQPYYQYDEILEPGEVSAAKQWTLEVPAEVDTFAFLLYVSTEVPFPEGYVELGADTLYMQPGDTVHLSPDVRTVVGNPVADPDPLDYQSNDDAIAMVDNDGVITAVGDGTAVISVTSGLRPGQIVVVVGGASHLWIGAISSDWADGGNWQRGVVPASDDSVHIPVVSGGNHAPELTTPVAVGHLEIDDGAMLSLATFNLTANGDVRTGSTGGIQTAGGTLLLAGSGHTIEGVLPGVIVTGTYTASANTRFNGRLSIRGGRITTAGRLLRVQY